ncbi:hypothetical protein, partial [Neisseria gonorrhoeae]
SKECNFSFLKVASSHSCNHIRNIKHFSNMNQIDIEVKLSLSYLVLLIPQKLSYLYHKKQFFGNLN